MTEYVEQTSASDRIKAAQEALANFTARTAALDSTVETSMERSLADALRALITPPAVGESEEVIVQRVLSTYQVTDEDLPLMQVLAKESIRAGVQAAHETWEPEVAQRPSQEQMLRWLGIDYEYRDPNGVVIHFQIIDKEEI